MIIDNGAHRAAAVAAAATPIQSRLRVTNASRFVKDTTAPKYRNVGEIGMKKKTVADNKRDGSFTGGHLLAGPFFERLFSQRAEQMREPEQLGLSGQSSNSHLTRHCPSQPTCPRVTTAAARRCGELNLYCQRRRVQRKTCIYRALLARGVLVI